MRRKQQTLTAIEAINGKIDWLIKGLESNVMSATDFHKQLTQLKEKVDVVENLIDLED